MANRNVDRSAFGNAVSTYPVKIQIGARNKKNGPDWLAVDLYDKSQLIDEHWDLHCLPLLDGSVDVCNAVLEHVRDADLALYEMFRTLRPGGEIWIEVPFSQFFHAHPNDFRRWTVPGIRAFAGDFEEISSGRMGNFGDLAKQQIDYIARVIGETVTPEQRGVIEEWASRYQNVAKEPRIYSAVYFWGRKPSEPISREKSEFYGWKRREYQSKMMGDAGYDPAPTFSKDDLIARISRALLGSN